MSYQQKNIPLYTTKYIFSFFNKKTTYLLFIICFSFLACRTSTQPRRNLEHRPHSHSQLQSDKPIKISRPYTVQGKTYYPYQQIRPYRETGIASWYGKKFHGRPTATGEIYNMYQKSAAHKLLPLNTKVRVTNLENGKKVIVRVNDRGPFVKNRIIDMSYGAACELGMVKKGTAKVVVETLDYLDKNIPSYRDKNTSGKFYIQISSFTQKINALKYKDELKRKGFARVRVQRANLDSGVFWRVQLGAYEKYTQAYRVMTKMLYKNSGCFIIVD